jgi:hypothetical protein
MPTKEDTVTIPAADWASIQARLAALESGAAQPIAPPVAAPTAQPFTPEAFAAALVFAQRQATLEGGDNAARYAQLMELDRNRPLWPQARYQCKSLITGSTFVAVVSPSRAFPNGRIVNLEDYRLADNFLERFPCPCFPEDMTTEKGQPSAVLKQHMYAEGWRADLREYVGKPFNPALNPEVAARLERLKAEALANIEAESKAVVASAQPDETKVS